MHYADHNDMVFAERIRRREIANSYRDQVAADMTPEFAKNIETFALAYPNMHPGVIVSLAKAGMSPADPTVQKIADLDFQKQLHTGRLDKFGDERGG